MSQFVELQPGDLAPWFHQRSLKNPKFAFDTVGGRYVVLCFFGSAAAPGAAKRIEAALARPDLFDDDRCSFFGVSVDPEDERQGRIADRIPGYRHFLDFDASVSRRYGAVAAREATEGEGELPMRPMWVLLDPALRVRRVIPFASDGADIDALIETVAALPPVTEAVGFQVQAPILVLPNVFDEDLCRALIDVYETHGGIESGFMREVDGKTVGVKDHAHKRRRDAPVSDAALVKRIQAMFTRKVIPQIARAHQFKVTRMERYIVGCYTAEDGGHFRAHRDNTTSGTAHRRFAVSVNLNDAFEGGEVSFPEYGPKGFKPPAGSAVVFSCSLLHRVSPVTKGRRYGFLPFLYDDAAAKVREANNARLGDGVGVYRGASGSPDPAPSEAAG